MAYGSFVIQRDLNFKVKEGEVFVIMGGSGCGKSTLLRHLIGLKKPSKGKVFIRGNNFWEINSKERSEIMRSMGVLYQSGALWSSMTLAENVSIPLQKYTNYSQQDINEIVLLKLALVGLAGYENFYNVIHQFVSLVETLQQTYFYLS